MHRVDAVLWVCAVLVFVGGDWLTTRRGLATAGVRETNPVARWLTQSVGLEAGLVALKAVALATGVAGYLYATSEGWPYPQLFPLAFLVVGLAVTAHNLRILALARRRR